MDKRKILNWDFIPLYEAFVQEANDPAENTPSVDEFTPKVNKFTPKVNEITSDISEKTPKQN